MQHLQAFSASWRFAPPETLPALFHAGNVHGLLPSEVRSSHAAGMTSRSSCPSWRCPQSDLTGHDADAVFLRNPDSTIRARLPKEVTRYRRAARDRSSVSPRHPTPETERPEKRVATPSDLPQTEPVPKRFRPRSVTLPRRIGASPVPVRRNAPKSFPRAPGQVPSSPESRLREVHPGSTP